MKQLKLTAIAFTSSIVMFSCGGESDTSEKKGENKYTTEEVEEKVEIDPMQDKGVGAITSVELGDLDQTLADVGKEVFDAKCTACHKMGKRFIGPDLTGVINRRTPEWIMNMILDPEKMVKENKIARDLLMEYSAPMANQSLTEEETRSILEYFRTVK